MDIEHTEGADDVTEADRFLRTVILLIVMDVPTVLGSVFLTASEMKTRLELLELDDASC